MSQKCKKISQIPTFGSLIGERNAPTSIILFFFFLKLYKLQHLPDPNKQILPHFLGVLMSWFYKNLNFFSKLNNLTNKFYLNL